MLDVNTRRLTVRTFVLLLAGLLLSSSIFAIVEAPTITPTSEPALDGYIYKKGENQYPPNQQTVVSTTSSLIRVGERVMEIINGMESYMYYKYRGYVSFDTSSIPSDHHILYKTLKLCVASSYPPDRNFELRVKCAAIQPTYGDSLDASDWEAGGTTVGTWNTANYPGRDQWIEIPVQMAIINRVGQTQFRLVSSLDEANQEPPVIPTNEEVWFYSGNSENAPRLEITYEWRREKPVESIINMGKREDTAMRSPDGHTSAGLGVHIGDYLIGSSQHDEEWAHLRIVATANTREKLDYRPTQSWSYQWVELTNYIVVDGIGARVWGSGDDWIEEINLNDIPGAPSFYPLFLRFYGAPGSGEYTAINVSSNGFVSFDWEATPDKYYSRNIPDPEGTDCFAAPFWTDLRPTQGGSIKIGFGYWGSKYSLVVTWDGVPDKNGVPQTFQMGIVEAESFYPATVFFQYQNIVIGDTVTIGIESEHGARGFEVDSGTISSGTAIGWQAYDAWGPYFEYAYLSALKITIERNDVNSIIHIIEDPDVPFMRGYNVKLESEDPDPNRDYASALAGETVLLLGEGILVAGGVAASTAGLIMTGVGLVVPIVAWAAYYFTPVDPDPIQDKQDINYARVPAVEFPSYGPARASDALFGIDVHWLMPDPFQDSSIDITATAEYFVYDNAGDFKFSRSVTTDDLRLTFTAKTGGHPQPNKPSQPSGPTSGLVGVTYTYSTSTTDPEGTEVRYMFDWGDATTSTTEWMASGATAYASHSWGATGTKIVQVKAQNYYGRWSDLSDPLTVTITSASCPFVYSWDGQEYRFEHEAYPFAVMKSVETTSFDRLQYLEDVDGEYRLIIEQVLLEKDWADSSNLYVVDHPGEDSFVMPDLQGDLHTVKDLVQPISAYEKNGDDCLEDVKFLDDRTWKDSIFDADVNDESTLRNWVVLTFPKPEGATEAKLMLSVKKQMTITKGWELFINLIGENYWNLWQKIMENPLLAKLGMDMMEREVNLKIEVWNGTEWIRQDSLCAGDALWDDFLAVLDVSGVEGDELQVRLYFTTSDYEINYVGIDYSEDEPMTVHEIDPYYAVKNGQEDVLFALGEPDENYVTLVPGDVIELRYEAIPESEWKRDFTIATKGYYNFVDFQDQTFLGFVEGAAMWLKAMTEPYFAAKTVLSYLQESQ